jgi:ABC-type Fe3+-hydroxamate transport system substrate-binding protein
LRRASRLALAFALAGALAGACRPAARAPAAREIKDELGRVLRVPVRAERIVSLAPSTTEILFAIGAGGAVVGVDRFSDFPPETASVAHVGSDTDPSLERIVALRPDVVFTATSANAQGTVEALERVGVPVFVSRVQSLADVYADVRAIGDAVGRAAPADALAADVRRRIEAVRARYSRAVKCAIVVWSEPLVVAGRTGFIEDVIVAAGGENVADSPQPFPKYSVERLLERAPEVLIVGTHKEGTPPMTPLERLTTLPAVRDHKVFIVDGDLLFRPGPRVADGVEALARLLHPTGGK